MRLFILSAVFLIAGLTASAQTPNLNATLVSPNGGEVFSSYPTDNQFIDVVIDANTWVYYNSYSAVTIELYSGTTVTWGPNTYPFDSSRPTQTIRIPASGLPVGTSYRVKLSNLTQYYSDVDWSDSYFEISPFYKPGNSIISTQILVPGILTEAAVASLTTDQQNSQVQYMDDLGVPKQAISIKGSPLQKDIVAIHEYDALNREKVQYLPVASASNDGTYKPGLLVASTSNTSYDGSPHYNFYNNATSTIPVDTKPYKATLFEKSPLSRVTEQGGIGAAFQPDLITPANGKTVKVAYASNAANEVFKWTIIDNGNLSFSLSRSYYSAQALQVSTFTNRHGLQSKEYKDTDGKTVLKKSQRDASTWAETYYVYDVYNNLRFVLPPEAVKQIANQSLTQLGTFPAGTQVLSQSTNLTSAGDGNKYVYAQSASVSMTNFTSSPGFELKSYQANESLLNRFAYQYVYDNLNRKIAEKAPENDWSYFVYDNFDRPVLTQNPNQRLTNEWTFTKYDYWNRPILSGTTVITGSVETIRQTVEAQATMYESRGGSVHDYTNNAYPNVADENSYTSVSYFDDYSFKSLIGSTSYDYKNDELSGLPSSESLRVKGFNTGGKTKLVGQDTWLWAVSYYDDRGRIIQAIGTNHKSGTDRISTLLNFPSWVLSTKVNHVWGSKSYSIKEDYEYDHAGRLLRKYHQIGADPAQRVMLCAVEYNELGQVTARKLHSTNSGSTFLQNINLRQNIQGGLTSQSSEDFELTLGYENNQGITGVTPRYNGDITSVSWMNNLKYTTPVTNKEQAWSFTYDGFSQLNNSSYSERDKGAASWGTASTKLTEGGLAYDLNGNVQTLVRKDSTLR